MALVFLLRRLPRQNRLRIAGEALGQSSLIKAEKSHPSSRPETVLELISISLKLEGLLRTSTS